MHLFTFFKAALLLCGTVALAESKHCMTGYDICNPAGEHANGVPQMGSGLSPLFVDIVNSVSFLSKRGVQELATVLDVRDLSGSVCCK